MAPRTFLRLTRKFERKMVWAVIIAFIIVPLASHPNKVLYHCVPNPFAALPSYKQVWNRGAYNQSFCRDGFYPVVRGTQTMTAAELQSEEMFTLLFVAVPALLVLPVIFILTQDKKTSTLDS